MNEGPKCWLVTLSEHVAPAGVEADTDNVTVPVKPFSGRTWIVDVVVAPARTGSGEAGSAATEKS